MRVLALASYDSFLNIARLIAPHFEKQGCVVEFALIKARTKKQISEDQIRRMGLAGRVQWVSVEGLCAEGKLRQYDIVLCCLEGTSTRRLLHHAAALGNDRPLLISVYPGLVLRHKYDGYSMRTGSDLVWLNSEADRDAFVEMSNAFSLDTDRARVLGIPSLLRRIEREDGAEDGPVVFFEQAVIPRFYDERLFLAQQLVRLARENPDRQFLVKARAVGGDATLHQAWHAFDSLLEASVQGDWPDNLSLTTENASRLLSIASHCLTVSSTVAAEAIAAEVPTVIIGDFGGRDDYGLHYFFGSGLICRFADLTFPVQRRPSQEWRARFITDPNRTIGVLVDEAIELAKAPRQFMAERLPNAEMSPELRKFLIERNGIDSVLSRSYQVRKRMRHGLKHMLAVLRGKLGF